LGWCSYGAKLLMIGAAKTQSAGVSVAGEYAVNLNPGSLNTNGPNGSLTSSRMNSSVANGVGPFEYLWVIDNAQITINTPTSDSTTFSCSAFGALVVGAATLTVTDKGNGDAMVFDIGSVLFQFGEQL